MEVVVLALCAQRPVVHRAAVADEVVQPDRGVPGEVADQSGPQRGTDAGDRACHHVGQRHAAQDHELHRYPHVRRRQVHRDERAAEDESDGCTDVDHTTSTVPCRQWTEPRERRAAGQDGHRERGGCRDGGYGGGGPRQGVADQRGAEDGRACDGRGQDGLASPVGATAWGGRGQE